MYTTRELGLVAIAMGHLGDARKHLAEMAAILKTLGDPLHEYSLYDALGKLSLREGDATVAMRHFARAESIAREIDSAASTIAALTNIGQTRLALGKPRAALTATRRGVELHRAHDLAALDGMSGARLWWHHSLALGANKRTKAAGEALEMAYRFMLEGCAGLSDEGLRRNYLNKIDTHREIVHAWIKDARKRRLSPERRGAHLKGEANLREPFERLVDTGLRLNELRSAQDLHEFLIDEATELSGAERVLLVLETPDGQHLAGSLVPSGEDVRTLLLEIAPSVEEVRRTRAVRLAYAPEGVDELDQRSSIIAPLIAQRHLLGYVYVDIDGAFGRFRESDRDLIGLLASQAAVALDNVQWSQGLEQKVNRAYARTAIVQCTARAARERARHHQQHPAGHRGGA